MNPLGHGTMFVLTPLSSRVWSLGKFFVLMGALGLTFLVFFAVSMRVALWAREVQVPSLVGRTVNEATAMLADPSSRFGSKRISGPTTRSKPAR